MLTVSFTFGVATVTVHTSTVAFDVRLTPPIVTPWPGCAQ